MTRFVLSMLSNISLSGQILEQKDPILDYKN